MLGPTLSLPRHCRVQLVILCWPPEHSEPVFTLLPCSVSWQAPPSSWLQPGSLALWLPVDLAHGKGWWEVREWEEEIYSPLQSFPTASLLHHSASHGHFLNRRPWLLLGSLSPVIPALSMDSTISSLLFLGLVPISRCSWCFPSFVIRLNSVHIL